MSTKSISVLDALDMRTRLQGELTPSERYSIESDLDQGAKKSMALGLLTWDSPDNCQALPYTRLGIRVATLQPCQTSQVWKDPGRQGVLRSIYDLFQSMSNVLVYDKYGTLGTQLAEAFFQPRLGWTWLADQGITGSATQRRSRGPLQGQNCWFEWTPNGPGDEALPILAGSGNLILMSSAFDICLLWLANETLVDELTSDQKVEARANLGHQLHEVRPKLVVLEPRPRPHD